MSLLFNVEGGDEPRPYGKLWRERHVATAAYSYDRNANSPYGRADTPLTVRAVKPGRPVTATSILLQAAGGAVSLG